MQKSLMPKGVDHILGPTHQGRSVFSVQKSLMPKGVDHSVVRVFDENGQRVQKSLMPKGVDHYRHSQKKHALFLVQKSLMPKGVDHPLPSFSTVWSSMCKNL